MRTIFTLTERAEARVKELMENRPTRAVGIKIGVASKGCNGLSYVLEYIDNPDNNAEILEQNGIKLFIEKQAVMYLIGTQMDYLEKDFKSGFIFINPNAKGQCGCGESFNV